MFDIEKFMTTSEMEVNATSIRFHDERTGEVFTRTIFRLGRVINQSVIGRELAKYGYALDWVDDQLGNIPGEMNWSEIFGNFIQQETES